MAAVAPIFMALLGKSVPFHVRTGPQLCSENYFLVRQWMHGWGPYAINVKIVTIEFELKESVSTKKIKNKKSTPRHILLRNLMSIRNILK